ncbi:scyllo-inosamine-4-phosphate amidinotransferase [Micromonospora aurantiaca (nom. illeg.)]|uniref:scyllo-inosamine-4-phosphate amidinotransferase n=1 Tax=Micromonospora aurantiaca (nom. illeg.) TaxID=47850 RepID=UPI0036752300
MTSSVWSVNDWDPLEEIILGTALGLGVPPVDVSVRHFFEPPEGAELEKVDTAVLQRVVDETEEDLAELAHILTAANVRVRRPDPLPYGQRFATLGWESAAMHALMPRDCLLVVENKIIEAPMAMRARFFEVAPFRRLLGEYFDAGAHWLSAPKPLLPDETYVYRPGESVVAELEPLFDAANMLRCGSDIFYNVSNSGNRRGAHWLRRVLGERFRLHEVSLCSDHLGTTLVLLRPGLLLANSERLSPDSIPEPLRSWKTIWVDRPEDDGFAFEWPRASVWVGMNVLSIGPDQVVVPSNQTALIRQLEAAGVTVIPARLRHGRTFGGGFHCCSLDVRRRGGDVVSYL